MPSRSHRVKEVDTERCSCRITRPAGSARPSGQHSAGAPDDDPAAAAVEEGGDAGTAAAETPVAEPALALVGGGQPARATARPAVSLAA